MGKAAATLKYRARTTPAGYRRLEQALLDMGLLYNAIITQRNNAIITQRNAATRPTATATAAGRPTATSPSSGSMSPTAATCTGS